MLETRIVGPYPLPLRRAFASLAAVVASLALAPFVTSAPHVQPGPMVLPSLLPALVAYYDFDHPLASDPAQETDLGPSGTSITLINGGAAMRVDDSAYSGSGRALRTKQVNPGVTGNDDWKAGLFVAAGVTTLRRFSAATGITLMGWIKPDGTNPNLNSTTPAPDDLYNAIGLFGLLAGNSDGHGVRALLELINVNGTMKLVALGRRLDAGDSLTLAADEAWPSLLPNGRWTHLAATFDFNAGTMALYRNGEPLAATYTPAGDRWTLASETTRPHRTSPTDPAGIKIGGSFPQNTRERNAFNGLQDDLMFFDRVASAAEVRAQFARFQTVR